MQETWVQPLGWEDSQEKEMATQSSILAWEITWTKEPGRLQSLGSLQVEHDWAALLSLFTFIIGEGNGNPLQCSCLENLRDRETWWAAVYGVIQSQTRLKWLSSSSSVYLLGFPWWLSGKKIHLPMQEMWVLSLG